MPKSTSKKRVLQVISFCLVVGALIWVWEEQIKDRVIPRRWGVVVPGVVYRSGQLSPALIEKMLAKHGIQQVVDFNDLESDSPEQQAEIQACENLGISHTRFPLSGDGTGDATNYVGALVMVHEAITSETPTLVHCHAGSQRTGAAIAFYRLLMETKDTDIVLAEMMKYDWDPEEDQILVEYINEHMAEIAEALVEKDVLESMPSPLPVLEL